MPNHSEELIKKEQRGEIVFGGCVIELDGNQPSERTGKEDFIVIAVGPTLDPVLNATDGLDLTVLYASSIRPFDAETLKAHCAKNVVLVEPYLAGTSSALISSSLIDQPHRLLSLGVRNCDLRKYGEPAEHAAAHGLDAAGLRKSIGEFYSSTS